MKTGDDKRLTSNQLVKDLLKSIVYYLPSILNKTILLTWSKNMILNNNKEKRKLTEVYLT